MDAVKTTLIVALVMAVLLCAVGAAWSVRCLVVARENRRRRLDEREPTSADAWFREFFPEARQREHLIEVLAAIGRHTGVSWTKLRPDDDFARSLAVEPSGGPEDEFLEFETWFEQWLKRNGLRFPRPDEMGSLLALLSTLDQALSEKRVPS